MASYYRMCRFCGNRIQMVQIDGHWRALDAVSAQVHWCRPGNMNVLPRPTPRRRSLLRSFFAIRTAIGLVLLSGYGIYELLHLMHAVSNR